MVWFSPIRIPADTAKGYLKNSTAEFSGSLPL